MILHAMKPKRKTWIPRLVRPFSGKSEIYKVFALIWSTNLGQHDEEVIPAQRLGLDSHIDTGKSETQGSEPEDEGDDE